MKKHKTFNNIKLWILKSFQFQLLLTLISLPILIHWGIPVSLATVIGNMIFTPILIIFIFLSSLIFFTEILSIPNGLIIFSFEQINIVWIKLIKLGSHKWMISFIKVSPYILIMIPIAVLLVIQNKRLNSLNRSTMCFSIILLLFCFFMKMKNIPNCTEEVALKNNSIKIIYENKKINLIDEGIFSHSNSWIEFTLIPHLNKKFGHTNIEKIILKKFTKRSIESLKMMCKKTQIEKIQILNNKHHIKLDEELLEIIKKQNIILEIEE